MNIKESLEKINKLNKEHTRSLRNKFGCILFGVDEFSNSLAPFLIQKIETNKFSC